MNADDAYKAANSYFGLFRQATRSHADRCRLANLILQIGLPVNHKITKAYQ